MKEGRFEQAIGELESKREKFREILTTDQEQKELPEVIFILAGGIKEVNGVEASAKQYESLSYGDADPNFPGLMTAGKDRVIAAAEIGKIFPDIKFVTTSAIEVDRPSYAAIMAEELIDRGISKQNIILEEKSDSTVTELVEMVKMAVKNGWTRINILTSGFHIPRTREIFNHLESILSYDDSEFDVAIKKFKKMDPVVSFISADSILINTSDHYQYLFNKVNQLNSYKERIAAEERGIRDIKAGVYKVSKRK